MLQKKEEERVTEMRVGSLVKIFILFLLLERPFHGYGLMKELRARIKGNVNPGQVYPFLSELRKKGLISVSRAGRKKVYSLTEKGERFVSSQLERFGFLVELALKPRLKVCSHCGCRVLDGFVKNGRVYCCRYCAESL